MKNKHEHAYDINYANIMYRSKHCPTKQENQNCQVYRLYIVGIVQLIQKTR